MTLFLYFHTGLAEKPACARILTEGDTPPHLCTLYPQLQRGASDCPGALAQVGWKGWEILPPPGPPSHPTVPQRAARCELVGRLFSVSAKKYNFVDVD